MIPFAFWEGLALGLAIAAVGSAVVWWYLSRRVRGGATRGAPPSASPHAVPPTAPPRLVPTARMALLESAPAVPIARAPAASPGGGLPALPVRVDRIPVEPPTNGGQLRISRRVLFHLARIGRVTTDEVAPRGLSQAGMVEALGVNQGALTGVLRRFEAAGILEVSREHVRGADRRLKVYRLTSSGEQLVRELRSQSPSEPTKGSGRDAAPAHR